MRKPTLAPFTIAALCVSITLGALPCTAPKAHAVAEPVGMCAVEPADTTIAYGDKIDCSLSGTTDLDIFRFPVTPNERVQITVVRTNGGNVCISLRRPSDGAAIGGDNCTRADLGRNTVALDRTVTEDDPHTIVVHGDSTSYRLALDRVLPLPSYAQSICNGCELTDDLDPHPDLDFVSFDGASTSRVNVRVQRLDGDNVCIDLRRLNGSSLGSDCTRKDLGRNTVAVEATLDETAKHTIVLYGDVVTYRLSLQCITGSCELRPTCNGTPATIWGTDGDNVLYGTDERDVITGRGGNDIIYGFGGNDLLCGDAGNDLIFGGDGNDRILGGGGSDLLIGEAGEDRLIGSGGSDLLSGGDDDDVLNAGSGVDVCDGGPHIGGDSGSLCEALTGVAP